MRVFLDLRFGTSRQLATILTLGGLAWLVPGERLAAQPALDRVEQMLREQVDAAADGRPVEPGYLGLLADDRQDEGKGVRILDVVAGGPAARGGLQIGDLIIAIGGQRIIDMDEMAKALQGKPAGARIAFEVERNGRPQQYAVTLARRPAARPPLPGAPAPDAGAIPPAAVANDGPRLGLRTLEVSEEARLRNQLPNRNGALVNSITAGSFAQQAGIPLGAVITSANDAPINTPHELAAAVRASGNWIDLDYVYRGERVRKRVPLTPTPLPPQPGEPIPPANSGELPAPGEGPALAQPGTIAPAPPAIASPPADFAERLRQLEERIARIEAALLKLTGPPTPPQAEDVAE